MWLAPTFSGVVLILFGLLILVYPWIINILIAVFFLMAGAALIGVGLSVRGRVTIRRMDDRGPFDV